MYNQRRLKKKWMRRRLKSVISKQIHHPNFHPSPKPAAAAAKTLRSCLTLCDPTDSSPPGSSVPGTLQARELEWVAISFSNACKHAKSLQSCPTLCGPMDSSPPGSSVHLILQARILEQVAISFSCSQTYNPSTEREGRVPTRKDPAVSWQRVQL